MKGTDEDIQSEENQLKLTETKKNSLKQNRKYIRQTAKTIIINATQRSV